MDSYEGLESDPITLHKYLYAKGNPINRIDPSGHMSRTESLVVLGMVATLMAITVLVYARTLEDVVERIKDDVIELEYKPQIPRPSPSPSPSPLPSPTTGPTPVIPDPHGDDDDNDKHRGSIQAQGDGIRYGIRQDLGDGVIGDGDTVSWSWAQNYPLSMIRGLEGLYAVKSKLGKAPLRSRNQAFDKAERFILRSGASGGLSTPRSYTFQNSEVIKRRGNERVDIVLNSGVAFVP